MKVSQGFRTYTEVADRVRRMPVPVLGKTRRVAVGQRRVGDLNTSGCCIQLQDNAVPPLARYGYFVFPT
jgi:hypothetical protein